MTDKPNLLILDGPRYPKRDPNPAYRGTFRSSPMHFDELPEDHEANLLFFWFLEEGGELAVVHDLAKACRLCELCNSLRRETSFEVIEATQEDLPSTKGEFLGFDISQGFNNSLLWNGLSKRVPEEGGMRVRVLANLAFRSFSGQLNAHGLFSTVEAASEYRAAAIALQALEPDLFESGELDRFVVIRVFRVGG